MLLHGTINGELYFLKALGMFFILVCTSCVTVTMVSATCFEMSPKDALFIKKGKVLNFSCSLTARDNSSDCIYGDNISDIRIEKGSVAVSSDVLVYHKAEKTAVTTIPNATFSDAGFYFCLYGDSEVIQAGLRVYVGEPPGTPERLRCLSRNWDDLTCNFLLSKQMVNIPTDWRMEFRLNWQDWITIPESNCNLGNCTCWLDSRTEPPSRLTFMPTAKYQVRVVVWNRLGNATSNVTIEQTTSIVKPSRVERFDYNFTAVSTQVSLHWSCPKSRFVFDYRIVVSSDWDNRTHLIHNSTAPREEYVLENLIAFVKYRVTVQARPSAAELDIYWSDNKTVDFVTMSAVSENAVTVTAGSYTVLDCGQQMCLVIYWRNPERRYWHGNITGYNITAREYEPYTLKTFELLFEEESKYVKSSSDIIPGMAVYGTLDTKLLKEKNYKVQIMLMNSEGVSRNHSEILIPNWRIEQAMRLDWVVVEMSKDSIFISWYMNPQYCSAVTSVTHYWCLEDSDTSFNSPYISCKDSFDWTSFNVTDGCGIRTYYMRKPLEQPNLKYAVSVKTRLVSGGLKWENFRFLNDNVPERPVYSVNVEGTTLTIRVQYRDYHDSKGGKPENYSVMYTECVRTSDCKSDHVNGTSKTFPADFLKPAYSINSLKPGTLYKVQVSSLNSFGSSNYGEPVMVTVATDVKVDIADVLAGTLTGVLLLALFLLCCLGRRRYKRLRRRVEIRIPEQDETTLMLERNELGKDIHTLVSRDHDSGKGSDSPVSRQCSDLLKRNESFSSRSSSNFTSSPAVSSSLDIVDGASRNSQDMMQCAKIDSPSCLDTEEKTTHGLGAVTESERTENVSIIIFGNPTLGSVSGESLDITDYFTDSRNINESEVCINDSFKTDATEYQLAHGCETSLRAHMAFEPKENAYLPNSDQENKPTTVAQINQKKNLNLEYVETVNQQHTRHGKEEADTDQHLDYNSEALVDSDVVLDNISQDPYVFSDDSSPVESDNERQTDDYSIALLNSEQEAGNWIRKTVD